MLFISHVRNKNPDDYFALSIFVGQIVNIQDTVIISKLSQIKFEYLSSKLIYVNSGATRPRTPRCFQVLDYPVLPMGSTMKFGIY